MATLEQYQAKVATLLAQRDKLTDAEVRSTLRLLADVRRSTLEELLKLANKADSFQYYQLQALRDAIDAQAADLVRRYRPIMGGALDRAWTWGEDFQPEMLKRIGVDLSLRQISRTQLQVAQTIAGDLVTQVGDDFRTQARQIITRGVMGAQSPTQVMKGIAKLLKTEPDRHTGKLGSIAYQAERIQRTEMAGVAELANRIQQDQVADFVPDVRKYWLATHDSRTRPAHFAAYERYKPGGSVGPIPEGDDFVVGGQRCAGPHDPRLSAAMRVNCRCTSCLYLPDWFNE